LWAVNTGFCLAAALDPCKLSIWNVVLGIAAIGSAYMTWREASVGS
jgi:hypothetical protein